MQAVIFDMDGTMVNNMMIHHYAWQRKLATLGLDWTIEEVKERVHGVNEEILERLFGDRFTPKERAQIAFEKEEAYREIFLPQLKLIDGLAPFLDQLKEANILMAVASAAPPENVDFVLDNLNLRSYFSAVLHSRSVENGKPHPEIYLKTAAALRKNPEDCVVFEDSVVGATAGANAGCPVIVVTTTHDKQEFKAVPNIRKFIADFTEITLEELYSV